MPKRVFLSAPAHNEVQQVGVGSLTKSIEGAGFECVYPDAPVKEKGFVDAVCTAARLELLKSCDMLITWIDGLLPEGLIIAALTQVTNQVTIPFPQEIQNVIDAGWQALGGSPASKQSKMILLPGEAPTAKDSPKSLTVGFGPGGITAQICSPPINLPEGNALVEAGIAMGLAIPVLAVALGPAAAGDYLLPGVLPMVGSFEALDLALSEINKADSLVDGLASILQGNIEDLAAMEAAKEKGENEEISVPAPADGEKARPATEPSLL